MKKIKDTEYLYCSARLRALECNIVGAERCERLVSARNAADIFPLLSEYGVKIENKPKIHEDDAARPDLEATLTNLFLSAAREVDEMLPIKGALDYLRFPHDCNNLKTAIKAAILGMKDEAAAGFSALGTRTPESAMQAAQSGDFTAFPSHMASAAASAAEEFGKSRDPQKIDIPLDGACYADMADAARGSFAKKLISAKVDLTNILTAVRIIRLPEGAAKERLLASSLLTGGTLDSAFFASMLSGGEGRMTELLFPTPYAFLGTDASANMSALERAADDCYMQSVKGAKFIPFGEEIPTAFLTAVEYSVKNIRIIYNSKSAGLPPEKIRERVRESYV